MAYGNYPDTCSACQFFKNCNDGAYREYDDGTWGKSWWQEDGWCQLYPNNGVWHGGAERCEDFVLDPKISRLNGWS